MASEKIELWCGMKIPIIVLSGEVNSGKSLFPLFIDATCRVPKEQANPTTIIFDQEGSAETYSGSLNFKWFDTREAVFNGVHRNVIPAGLNDPKWLRILKTKADVNDSPSSSMFRAAYLSLLSIEPGKYRVMGFDTFTPIQEGMVDWLRRHPEAFGRTTAQYEKAASMFLWPDVKAMLGHILAVDCRLRFETVCLCVHLKAKWEGDRKTKDRIAEGLDTLDKLATLHIRLERATDANGTQPKEPIGILMKERMLRFGATPDDDSPILPPRIEKCTPDTIRAYIGKPANYSKLKKAEKAVVHEPTEVELQAMRLATAEAEAESANAKLALADRQRELLAIREAAKSTTPQQSDQTAAANRAAAEKREADALATRAAVDLAASQEEGKRLAAAAEGAHAEVRDVQQAVATNHRVERFKSLMRTCGIEPGKILSAMQAQGAQRFTDLTEANQDGLLAAMQKAADKRATEPAPN